MKTMNGDHVSAFALDVWWASEQPRDPALEQHLATCGRCRAHLTAVVTLRDANHSVAAPPWPPPRRARHRWLSLQASSGRRSVFLAAVVFLLGAGAVLLLGGRHTAPTAYVAVKGAPGVQVLVHRQGDTHLWDGRSPLRPGDSLALLVACEGLGHVTVASPGPIEWERLSNAECPRQGGPLPFTLVVDTEPGDERLAVVLSKSELDDKSLRGAIAEAQRTSDVWVANLTFPKEIDR